MNIKGRESIFTVNLSRRDFIKTTDSGVAVLTLFGCSDSDENSSKDIS